MRQRVRGVNEEGRERKWGGNDERRKRERGDNKKEIPYQLLINSNDDLLFKN